MKKIMLFMSAALLLSSCGLYNKYDRPEVKADGIVRDPVSLTDTLAVQDTESFGNMPWRSVFIDPQLQTLIQQGLDNNPDLLNAALNVKQVEAALTVARLAFLPSLTLAPQGTIASFDGAHMDLVILLGGQFLGNLHQQGVSRHVTGVQDSFLVVEIEIMDTGKVVTHQANHFTHGGLIDNDVPVSIADITQLRNTIRKDEAIRIVHLFAGSGEKQAKHQGRIFNYCFHRITD